jgi:hypothetical protein
MSASKKQGNAVRVEGDVFDSLKAYTELTGVNISAVASKAIRDWMETVGAVHMEVFRKTKFQVSPENGKVVAFPTSGPDLLEAAALAAHVSARGVTVVPSPDPLAQAVVGAHINLAEQSGKPD